MRTRPHPQAVLTSSVLLLIARRYRASGEGTQGVATSNWLAELSDSVTVQRGQTAGDELHAWPPRSDPHVSLSSTAWRASKSTVGEEWARALVWQS